MKNLFLYFSAFVPLYFLIIVKFVLGLATKTMAFELIPILTLAIYSVLTILGIVGLAWNKKSNKGKTKQIIVVQFNNITDQHFLGYFSLFVLFALGFQLTMPSMFIVSLFIIAFVGVVYINNQMFYINPLLNILGYSFYEITYHLKETPNKKQTAKIFCKNKLENKTYFANFQNENFVFIEEKIKTRKK